MRKFSLLLNIIVIFEFLFIVNLMGQKTLDDSLMNGNNFEKAAFRLWYNKDVKTIRGIIVLIPGSNEDGRNMINNLAWQDLASCHDFALLGCYFKDSPHKNMDIEIYADAKNGSGQVLLDILKGFSEKSSHPELEMAPLALWGTSAGGEFNYEFACWKPERVIAFVVNKGGTYFSSLAPSETWDVPGLFFTGEKDSPYRNNVVKGIFSMNRRFGAKWILTEEIGTAHEFEKSEVFARFFFDNIIPLRLAGNKIEKLSSIGYIGNLATGQILPDSEKSQSEITSWFPNRFIADKWLEFTNKI